MEHTPARVAFRRPWPGTRRGFCLWLFAWSFVVIGGLNYIVSDLPPEVEVSLSFALSLRSPEFWGWTMVGVGVLSAWSSYCHLGRDRYGFVLLSTWCAAWALGYLCGFLFYDAGLRAVSGSVIWLLFSAILATLAGFPNVALNNPHRMVGGEDGADDE